MTVFTFSGLSLRNADGSPAANATVPIYAKSDTGYTTPLDALDMSGTTTLPGGVTSDGNGDVPDFKADVPDDVPSVVTHADGYQDREILSIDELIRQAQEAITSASAALASALAAQSAAEGAAQAAAEGNTLPVGGTTGQVLTKNSGADRDAVWATPPSGGGGGATEWDDVLDRPDTFPASPHSHPLTQVEGTTGLGRQLMAADTAQAARNAIGAGTGNGTSNLQLGSTGSTAAAGNHAHAAPSVSFTPSGPLTANNVQDAIVQAAATGGGGGTSAVLVWRYSSGAYPTLPASKPAGVTTVQAQGPVQPTSVPSWVGLGASQATLFYQWAPLT